MHMSRLLIGLCGLALVCCEKAPRAPKMDAPSGIHTIQGTERIGWEQSAADAVELSKIRYVIYVDGVRTALDNVSCVPTPPAYGAVAFPCTAGLPTLTAGAHTLELATVVESGGPRESVRSAPLHVNVVPKDTQAPHDGKR
jgi:hypothetical protein